ncbi:MAG: tRNA pseudouridine(13) synthase TruD [Candidatus Methanomethylophilaceae archaeon]|nr:tRNA pseudouridine(13) synthase TruD [Candidatus Methanomethylophilaceae archaeon]
MPARVCNTDEAQIGLQYYLSTSDGTGGRLKTFPEDFRVEEISDHPPLDDQGRYTITTVTSNNWETNRLIRLLARTMRISQNRIGFAGTKDKRAITSQLMSFEAPPEALDMVDLKDVYFSEPYRSRKPIQIGDLIGNRFHITVRDCQLPEDDLMESLRGTAEALQRQKGFPNFFGVQRFGVARPITHRVGEHIVRGDLRAAVHCYLSEPSLYENQEVREMRAELVEESRFPSLLASMPKTMSFEKMMVEHLVRRPEDYAGAIRSLPSNLQMMFVHAYQSYLFNLMLSERMRRGLPLNEPLEGDVVIPVGEKNFPLHEQPQSVSARNLDLVARQTRMGRAFVTGILFGSESGYAEGIMGEIERSVIERENIQKDDFIVPGLPYCNSKGSRRELLCNFSDLRHEIVDEGYTVSFSLNKGNYATCLMREFMKSDMECY